MIATAGQIARELPGAVLHGDGDVEVTGVTHDSREARSGFLFAALEGAKTDGRRFVDDALARGASAVLAAERLGTGVPEIVVSDPRAALGLAAAACYGHPTRRMGVAAVTGTNGKTTTTYLVESALRAAGLAPAVMGTVEYRFGERRWDAAHTTPEAPVIQSVAREMAEAGATHLVMEASSHGLALGRLNGCRFRVAAFTNLTQDHLDFHRTMERYAAAKMLLFTRAIEGEPDARAVVNADDPFGREILALVRHPSLSVSCDPSSGADIRPLTAPSYSIDGIEARLVTPGGEVTLTSPLLGEHNLANLVLALGICIGLGVDAKIAVLGLARATHVPGRLERISNPGGAAVLIDYAHTPDALTRALAALRPLTRGRLICVFGCGGDRDPGKRPLMGRAVAQGADLAVVTSDNPRTEEKEAIVDMILPGVVGEGLELLDGARLAAATRGHVVELDRRAAIRLAIFAARPEDTVLIAGKGHEDYQILGTRKIHFDDREEARAALEARGGSHG
ncbi:MAG: UDP-N-acetylmuramoyl-L-alanyl-D-glutamate--2,6-diaminopimelate ligase [Deltaproteobacteria bacterium]|nr:UDP-N-acetylmuramoyl-L-alanyl-D-glutamate--2,6-diaminopimelate ligase [Deltaproteobacteria bacterium]